MGCKVRTFCVASKWTLTGILHTVVAHKKYFSVNSFFIHFFKLFFSKIYIAHSKKQSKFLSALVSRVLVSHTYVPYLMQFFLFLMKISNFVTFSEDMNFTNYYKSLFKLLQSPQENSQACNF